MQRRQVQSPVYYLGLGTTPLAACAVPRSRSTVCLSNWDGQKSIRRSYTPTELRRITASALADSGSGFRHSVAPLYARQTIDIVYAK